MKRITVIGLVVFMVLSLSNCGEKEEKDTEAPIIVLKGSVTQNVALNSTYVEPGYTATDNKDGDITDLVNISSNVDTSIEGNYERTYSVIDEAGNQSETQTRKVVVLIF